MPIYYNEEANAWYFDQVTEKEKEILNDLGQRHFINDMVFSLVKKQMREDEESLSFEEYLESMDKEQLPSA